MKVGNVNGAQDVRQTIESENVKVNQQKVDLSDPVDKAEFSSKKAEPKKEVSTGKKVGVGIASAIIPGLGQFINGEPLKGIAMVAGHAALALSGLWPLSIGVDIVSIVDAVKNAK